MSGNKMVFKITVYILMFFSLFMIPCCQPPPPAPVTPSVAPTPLIPAPMPPAVQSTAKKLTLADSPEVLNLLPLLPSSFERIDAATEGLSNSQLDLGPEFSEVEVFLSKDPFQLIYGFIYIVDSVIRRASEDISIKDEANMRKIIEDSLNSGAANQGMSLEPTNTQITYPNIGDLALYGQGKMQTKEINMGVDVIFFREHHVYVMLFTAYYPPRTVELTSLSDGIIENINTYR